MLIRYVIAARLNLGKPLSIPNPISMSTLLKQPHTNVIEQWKANLDSTRQGSHGVPREKGLLDVQRSGMGIHSMTVDAFISLVTEAARRKVGVPQHVETMLRLGLHKAALEMLPESIAGYFRSGFSCIQVLPPSSWTQDQLIMAGREDLMLLLESGYNHFDIEKSYPVSHA